MRAAILAVTLFGSAAISIYAQPASAFEVASVKAAPRRDGKAALIGMDQDPSMLRYSNITLKILIAIAYRFDSRLVRGGPPWLDEQAYDVVAKLPDGTPKDRVPAMLQALLVERFKLAVRRETREERVYFLVAAKSGSKLKQVREPEMHEVDSARGDRLPMQMTRGGIRGRSVPVGSLAGALASSTGYQVVDRTGLSGLFDIDLKWRPEDSKTDAPDLFTALQEQLGLKLDAGKGPVEVLLVDRAERIPVEN